MCLTSVVKRIGIIAISVVWSSLHAASYGRFTLQDFQTRAAFDLVVNNAKSEGSTRALFDNIIEVQRGRLS